MKKDGGKHAALKVGVNNYRASSSNTKKIQYVCVQKHRIELYQKWQIQNAPKHMQMTIFGSLGKQDRLFI